MTKLSILVPCRNGEKYLAACIQSILAQSFSDFELLLIDDASGDRSRQIMETFAGVDGRIRILTGPGKGVCSARNLGLREAKGEWVLFVDADDLLPTDSLRTLFGYTDDPQVDMVVGAHETFGDGMDTVPFWPETPWYNLPWPERQHAMALRLIEGDSILNIMCNKLHRRSAIGRTPIRLSETVRVAEDALFNLEAVLTASGTAYCHAITYRYRMHPQSTMNQASGSTFDLHRPWLCEMRRLLTRLGVFETYYGAYVDSVTLRLYKDGGISGVVHTFDEKAMELVRPDGLNENGLSGRDRRTAELIRKGRYARLYPFFALCQIAHRKTDEVRFALRRGRELRTLMRTEAVHD